MDQQNAPFNIFIYSTIFMSTLHVSNDLVDHPQEFFVVYFVQHSSAYGRALLYKLQYDRLLMTIDKIVRNM